MIHNNLAVIYAIKGLYREAEKEFAQEIRINPQYGDAYFNLGMLYRNTGRVSEAIRMWRKVLDIDPHHRLSALALAKYDRP